MRIILIFLALLIFTPSRAQWSYAGEFEFIHFSGTTGLQHFGAGLRGEYEINEWTGIYGAVSYFLPQSYEATTLIVANSPATVPYTKIVPVSSRISFTRLGIGGKRYFIGRYEGDDLQKIGFYGSGGFGLMFGARTSDIPNFDDQTYWSPIVDEEKGVFVNWIAGLGAGCEYLVGKTYLYLSVMSRYTIDQANQKLIKTEVPFTFNYNFGMRIPFVGKGS
ncbi:MAG: hypothetical protein ACJAZ2_000236 [Glaciecola sp.]|jgi:hypothetical protein